MSRQYLLALAPIAQLDTLKAFAVASGHTENEWSVLCAPGGAGEPTHIGLCAWARPETIAQWQALRDNPALAGPAYAAAFAAVVFTTAPDNPAAAFDTLAATLGVARIKEGNP